VDYFDFDDQRLAYTIYGSGDRATVLLPGLLVSVQMQEPLARALAARGNRVVTLDPLGHGASDRPEESWRYSMNAFAQQTIGLLDHLQIERAVVGGTSLGANVTLEVASIAPERLQGMLIEMPVLERAVAACGIVFSALLVGLKLGGPVSTAVAQFARRVPREPLPFLTRVGLDWISQDPGPSVAVLSGMLYGRAAPDHRERLTFQAPALVIGHPADPVHPFSDAGALASELPNGRLVNASWILELRTRPARLTRAIADFIDECWAGAAGAAPIEAKREQRRASAG
jgi:pimeloyl-ACP methyl ester carboxylesterase